MKTVSDGTNITFAVVPFRGPLRKASCVPAPARALAIALALLVPPARACATAVAEAYAPKTGGGGGGGEAIVVAVAVADAVEDDWSRSRAAPVRNTLDVADIQQQVRQILLRAYSSRKEENKHRTRSKGRRTHRQLR